MGSLVGLGWGFVVSTSTLATCTAVSISEFLNLYYAGILTFLGGALVWKYYSKNRKIGLADIPYKQRASSRKSIGENLFHVPFDLR